MCWLPRGPANLCPFSLFSSAVTCFPPQDLCMCHSLCQARWSHTGPSVFQHGGGDVIPGRLRECWESNLGPMSQGASE
jgi:hypothetical protein